MDEKQVDILRDQLRHLNERSRWYTTQTWQVAFSYVGIAGVTITSMTKGCSAGIALAWVFWIAGFVGLLVIWHIVGIQTNVKRAVNNLRDTETELGLTSTAKYTFNRTTLPILLIVGLFSVGSILAGFYFRTLGCARSLV